MARTSATPHRLAYKVSEAADALGVARQTVYNWIAAGELGSVKIGKARRIPAADLEALIERHRVGGAQ